jgi:hypothetical protein
MSAFDPNDLVLDVAQAMFCTAEGEKTAQDMWDGFTEEERDGLLEITRLGIQAFTAQLGEHGIKLLPPGVLPRPASADEANMMIAAGREFLAGQKRKGGLVGSVAPKLIVPGRAH